MRLTSILVLPVLFALQPNGSTATALPLGDDFLHEIQASDFTCFNTTTVSSLCQQCKSNGNGNYVKCDTEPDNTKGLVRYVNANLHDGPKTVQDTETCPGDAITYPDPDCEMNVIDSDPCERTYKTARYTGTTEVTCPAPEEGPPKGN